MNRRLFIGAAAISVAAVSGAVGKAAPFFGPGGSRLGLELYTVAADLDRDFAGTLRQVRQAGYERVELSGWHGRSVDEVAAALQHAGLAATCAHAPATYVSPSADPAFTDMDTMLEACRRLQLRYVFLSALPVAALPVPTPGDPRTPFLRAVTSATRADYRRCARLLNETGRRLAPQGVQIGYHSHNFEFAPLDGTTGFEILMRETDPALVAFELDVGWLAAAGLDAVEMLTRYPGRFKSLHVKDIRASTRPNFSLAQDPAEVGAGMIPWPTILPAARAAGVQEYFVEQEPPFRESALRSIRQSAAYLKALSV